ncbi:hematopoietic prostaglandin D synthase [Procambarus clarkii]|uniref:hematopoietic prostaglandin D synthase n=1 Tax=Procambarus clarkii TaxID=6728 RepID=UPI003743D856
MPEYKLIYFNARGRAELIRWIFAYGDIPYTDERVEKEDWPEKKKNVPGGKVPVLMVDGKPLPQSLAIARYVAKQADLVPQDHLEAAYCDALADTLAEVKGEAYKIMFSSQSEEEKKKVYREEFFPNVMAPVLERLEKRLQEREWFVSDKVTWADLMISLVFGEVQKRKAELLEAYPAVVTLVNKVRDILAIKQWLETAPDTPF